MEQQIHLEKHCYVLLQGNWIHPITHLRHDLLWYPERAMTLYERHAYCPFIKSVVTEEAWIIGCYSRENVRVVYDDGSWQCPDVQTYGASHNGITHCLLGIQSTIPAMTMDGGDNIKKAIGEYKDRIDKANKVYKLKV